MTDHLHPETVGRPFPKAWIIGKTLSQIEGTKPTQRDIERAEMTLKRKGWTIVR